MFYKEKIFKCSSLVNQAIKKTRKHFFFEGGVWGVIMLRCSYLFALWLFWLDLFFCSQTWRLQKSIQHPGFNIRSVWQCKHSSRQKCKTNHVCVLQQMEICFHQCWFLRISFCPESTGWSPVTPSFVKEYKP